MEAHTRSWRPRPGPGPGPNRARAAEAGLLVLAVAITLCGHAYQSLAVTGSLPPDMAVFSVVVAGAVLAAHLAVRRFAEHADPLLLPVTALLSGIGLVLLYRLDAAYEAEFDAPAVAPVQLVWCGVGVAVCVTVVVRLKDYRRLQRYLYLTTAAALVLLGAPALSSGDTYGAKRWIVLGPMSFQPGEFVKIMMATCCAGYLVTHRDALALTGRRLLGVRLPRGRQLGPIALVWLACLFVLAFERDLGTALIFFGLFVITLYVATGRTGWIACGLLMAAVGAGVVGSFESYVQSRVVAWLHPFDIFLPEEQRPKGLISDQLAQALFSFGSGGLTGTGLGGGHPEMIKFAGRSDFVLTTVGEELGLTGVTAVLLLYALLVQRGLRTALMARDPFGKLLATGLAVEMALQVFVVTGGVTGLIPLTGKALPFLAQGGTSLVANWLLVALLIKISDGARRHLPAEAEHGDSG
ncbi:FtsW/RodA/SpoVE family cell cycle protein [Streptomyces sp. NPDC089919]|uniref:FtsW/RodA/SpoVE family cell cycle protein n=1 Tax=Streptomyces sp. NPDC089919 TaxID=3155188 RepID=UPI003415F6AD